MSRFRDFVFFFGGNCEYLYSSASGSSRLHFLGGFPGDSGGGSLTESNDVSLDADAAAFYAGCGAIED
jgi:hypothetical protein